jgi:hypothetical protein
MSTYVRNAVVCLALLVVGAMLSGCASNATTPTYQKVQTIPDNMAVVYLYRPASVFGCGVSFDVKAAEVPVVNMVSGGYYPYFAPKGELELSAKTEARSAVTVDVVPGQAQYVKCTVGVGFFLGRPHLMVVQPEVAEKEIAKCRLLEPVKK